MRERWTTGAVILAVALLGGSMAAAAAEHTKAAAGSAGATAATEYEATLSAANGSGVNGTAHLTLRGRSLHVVVDASGLTPGRQHMAHLHGKTGENVSCDLKDTNGDGMVDEKEAEAQAGKEVLFLRPFPSASKDGKIHIDHTYTIDPAKVGPIEDRVVELHGMERGGKWIDTLPVACGKPAKR